MKRPMAVTGACAVLSLAAFLLLGTGIAIVTAIVAAVGLFYVHFSKTVKIGA